MHNQSYIIATMDDNLNINEEDTVVRRRREMVVGGGVNSLKRRPKNKQTPSRRISCADLGTGAYQGWLYARKPRKSKWEKCTKWCVIKDSDLFVYDDQRDKVARSRIYLPLFKVSDANKETKQKGAFKLANEGTTFYFRCKTDEEKYPWMNYLSLTAIQYPVHMVTRSEELASRSTNSSSGIDVSSNRTTPAYSDDEDEPDGQIVEPIESGHVTIRKKKSSIQPPDRLRSQMDNNNALRKLVTSIREADLNIIGDDREMRRQSQLRKSLAQHAYTISRKNSAKNKRIFMLRAKERQKQALEQELSDIQFLLDSVSRPNINEFLSRYPEYQDDIRDTAASADDSLDQPTQYTDVDDGARASCDTLQEVNLTDRETLTQDYVTGLDGLNINNNSDNSARSSANSPVFRNGQKYNQCVTQL